MYVAGMDMGSYMSKLLILDQEGKEMVREKENSGVLYGDTAKNCWNEAARNWESGRKNWAESCSPESVPNPWIKKPGW